jgi:hypothetical protein
MNAPQSNRRRHERRVIRLEAELIQPEVGRVSVYTNDLSEGGAFIIVPRHQRPPVGASVKIRLPSTPWHEGEVILTARVVRVTDEGIGLQFYDFDSG